MYNALSLSGNYLDLFDINISENPICNGLFDSTAKSNANFKMFSFIPSSVLSSELVR